MGILGLAEIQAEKSFLFTKKITKIRNIVVKPGDVVILYQGINDTLFITRYRDINDLMTKLGRKIKKTLNKISNSEKDHKDTQNTAQQKQQLERLDKILTELIVEANVLQDDGMKVSVLSRILRDAIVGEKLLFQKDKDKEHVLDFDIEDKIYNYRKLLNYVRELNEVMLLKKQKYEIYRIYVRELEKEKDKIYDLIEAEHNLGIKISSATLINIVEESIKITEETMDLLRFNPYFKKLIGIKNRLIFEGLPLASKGKRFKLFVFFGDILDFLRRQ